MSSFYKAESPGPYPQTDYHVARMLEGGGRAEDFEALRWSVPGAARRNMLRGLLTYRSPRGRAAVEALSDLLSRAGGAIWQRKMLFRKVTAELSPLADGIEGKEWALLLGIALLQRPELAEALDRGGEGPRWVGALSESGWRDSARREIEMEVAR